MVEAKHDAFISYARGDGSIFAQRLEDQLSNLGISVWLDKRNLNPSQDFTAEIEKALEQTAQVVVCLTPDSKREDGFVRRELQYAIALKKPIVPLLFDNLIPPIHISTITYIDFRQEWNGAFDQLLSRLRNIPAAPQPALLPDDPFRSYLNALYKDVVAYLDKTVLSLINLSSDVAPGVVETRPETSAALPHAFFDMLPDDNSNDETSYADLHMAFQKYEGRLLLLGKPGGGKTTALMAFAREAIAKRLASREELLPIVVPIATWDPQRASSLTDWLKGQVPMLPAGEVKRIIDEGNALLLLDGLDELGVDREDEGTNERFDPRTRFMNLIPANNQILVTCRARDYDKIGRKIALNGAIKLQELSDAQRKFYLVEQPHLLAIIEADRGLREITRNPLLLSLFTFAFNGLDKETQELLHLKSGELRDKILGTYVKRRYEREARKPYAHPPFSLEKIYEVLGRVAMADAGGNGNMNIFSPQQFENHLVKEDIPSFNDFVSLLNILIEEKDHKLRFIHLLMRDHFAFRYAQIAINDRDENIRDSAAWALWQIPDERAIPILISALDDPHKYVRGSAAAALGRIGDPVAVPPLVELLADEEEVFSTYGNRVCAVAAAALEMIDTPEARAALEDWRSGRSADS